MEVKKDVKTILMMKSVDSTVYDIPLIQIMNEIYDEFMIELPETLTDTFEMAQSVKEQMYRRHIKRLVQIH